MFLFFLGHLIIKFTTKALQVLIVWKTQTTNHYILYTKYILLNRQAPWSVGSASDTVMAAALGNLHRLDEERTDAADGVWQQNWVWSEPSGGSGEISTVKGFLLYSHL